jgi:hypothetical protein
MSASSPSSPPAAVVPSSAKFVQVAPGATAKLRNPVAVALLGFVTLGIYAIYWWYQVNREMADYGRAQNTTELGDNPTTSTLALFPGSLIIVPAVWTTVTTFRRVQAAQRLTGRMAINGWLALVLCLVIFPAFYGYAQSGLNEAWKASAHPPQARPEPVQEPVGA